ncbi:MAG TPA: IclR family transcriptional regulator C-terminal domain-containing protein [Candidatus Binatia bacterium]|nr:IclR family transcriptional regulator C-terminal domain-containing protein [Candidatus Binatia bacterium]
MRSAAAAPIFEYDGKVRYSLTITLTPFRLRAKRREKLVRLVKNSAEEISLRFGRHSVAERKAQRAYALKQWPSKIGSHSHEFKGHGRS